jgi:iron complex transport system ATP-binding protein
MSILLEARSLTFAYRDRPVVREVSVALSGGEIVTFLGPNGSGKSTLIKLLLGHLRGAGTILWEGRDVAEWNRRELARRVAYLPQSPGWEAEQRVADVLCLGRAPYWRAFGIESAHDIQVVKEVAAMLGLEDLLDRRIDEISGGQRQRVFLGRCLVQEPRAMLLDEPNTFLDLRHQVELCQLLRQLARDKSIGVLMASHDLNLAGAFADRLVVLHEGSVVAAGRADEVLRADLLGRVYGMPMARIDRAAGKAPVVIPDLPM